MHFGIEHCCVLRQFPGKNYQQISDREFVNNMISIAKCERFRYKTINLKLRLIFLLLITSDEVKVKVKNTLFNLGMVILTLSSPY
jgi:hypothetical protein